MLVYTSLVFLADVDIRARLSALQVEVPDGAPAYDAAEQVQPCSIDLRLDRVFWEPLRSSGWLGRRIDLVDPKPLDLDWTVHWKESRIGSSERMLLRPGEILLARTLEQFTIPPDCAGLIEGRSSFARLGLAIHCTGGFINPGWRGHMPLQLVNQGPVAISIAPHLPLCQLFLIKLSSEPALPYGASGQVYSSGVDDGGPSRWFRGKLVSRLSLGGGVEAHVVVAVDERLRKEGWPQNTIVRALSFAETLPRSKFSNAHDLLVDFSRVERRRALREKLFGVALPVVCGVLAVVFGTASAVLQQLAFGPWVWVSSALLAALATIVAAAIPAALQFRRSIPTYYERDGHPPKLGGS